jgi:hypothetical protein
MAPESRVGIDSPRFTRAETYGKLREWAERLKNFEGVPDMYRDIPSYPESLTKEFNRLDREDADEAARASFLDKHLDYLDTVRRQVQLKDPGYLKTQQVIAENYDKYPGGAFSVGLDPAKELQLFGSQVQGDVTPFSKGFIVPAHEIFGHLRPSLYGIQPAYNPVTVPGLPGVYKPSIVSPTNESLAHFLNEALVRNLGASPETVTSDPVLSKIRSELKGERFPHFSTALPGRPDQTRLDPDQILDIATAARDLEQTPDKSPWFRSGIASVRKFLHSPPSVALLETHPRLFDIVSALRGSNYLSQSDLLSGFDVPKAARDVITREFLDKYVDPTLRNFREGLRISTPGFEKYTDSGMAVSRGRNPLDENTNLVGDKLATLTEFDPLKQYSPLGMMIFGAEPATAAARGAVELAKGLRRTPSALLPGVADLIPSPEAIQTGYAQGPVAMGAQMGREFLQSLPAAAASSAVLATPAAAPLAPGIGAGLVGTAAARALNEVVRQETGEGIVPKLRQALGTAPRTGIASPARVGERPLVAQIKPLSAAQKKEATRLASLNPLQQGIRLAQERFNPTKGEFGGSEVLKGLLDYINQKVKGR